MPSLSQTLQASISEQNKEWEDLNYDQKVEKLMQVVTRMFDTLNQQSATIFKLNETIRNHEHDEDGDVFTREYLDQREKKYYAEETILRSTHVSNPLNVRALKPKPESDITEVERPY